MIALCVPARIITITRTSDATSLAQRDGFCNAPGVARVLPFVVVSGLISFSASWGQGAATPAVLTTCALVRSLPRTEAARGLPVQVRGVVTVIPPAAGGGFTLDDGTGVWVARPQVREVRERATVLAAGDLVEVTGRSLEGHFNPSIAATTVRVVGRSSLPPARVISPLDLGTGALDSQRVSITGVVEAAELIKRGERTELRLVVNTPGGQFSYALFGETEFDPNRLIDSEVSVTGVFLAFFNARRQFLGVRIWSHFSTDLSVLAPAREDAFAAPSGTLSDSTVDSVQGGSLHRRRIKGVVTLCKPGRYFYLQDEHHALRVSTQQRDVLHPGDVVEVAGFFHLEHHRAEMSEAVFRRVGRTVAPAPLPITAQAIFPTGEQREKYLPPDYDDRLVTMRGSLVSLESRSGEPWRLNLDWEGVLIPVELAVRPDTAALAALRPGSELRVTGVCALSYSESRQVVEWPRAVALRLLARGPGDVEVLRAASWWTPTRLWIALGLISLGLSLALAWVVLLRRTVALRGAELAEAMRARRDAAVEFESTLKERNRLAADLHDTTEQSLTGLAFQLEAAEALQSKVPERSVQHMGLARQLLARSREDLRRSIWNLRANPLERNSLLEALREVAADRCAGTAVRIELAAEGNERALPDFVAGNLLLLTQEAITNALKHAKPTRIELRLGFAEKSVTLTIRDDGHGFDPSRVAGPKAGHFGLQGMRERMKRLGGTFELTSAPGGGTAITVSVPE